MQLTMVQFRTAVKLPDGHAEHTISMRNMGTDKRYRLSFEPVTRLIVVDALEKAKNAPWTVKVPVENVIKFEEFDRKKEAQEGQKTKTVTNEEETPPALDKSKSKSVRRVSM